MKLYIRLLWILAVLLLPLMLLGIMAAVVQVSALVRYDPAYFSELYIDRYSTPGTASKTLELALQTDDAALLEELQGLRRPGRFEVNPNVVFVELWESSDWYVTYLYFDELTYERYLYSFERVGDRWVVAPDDLYYVMRSGRWKEFFVPIAIGWWLLGGIVLVAIWSLHGSSRFRAWLAKDVESGQAGE